MFAFIIAGALLVWIADAILDYRSLPGSSFFDIFIYDLSAHELVTRLLFILSFMVLGFFMSRMIGRMIRLEDEKRGMLSDVERSERFLSTIFDSIRDPFMIIDRDYRIIRANQAYSDLKKIALDDLLDEKCYAVTRNREDVCEDCIVARTFRSGDPSAKEKRIVAANADEWVEIYTYPILDQNGSVTHVIEYVRNITDRKRAEAGKMKLIEDLETLSSIDSLTGLLNRRILFERLRYELNRAGRYELEMSVMFCDLDLFKEINDTYGHKTGDDVLKGVAAILKQSLRVTDIIGRYGGDEFLIVLPQTSLAGARELAERIRIAVMNERFMMPDGGSASLTTSIGVTNYNGRNGDVDDLINRIDNALYVSKRSGKNQVYSLG